MIIALLEYILFVDCSQTPTRHSTQSLKAARVHWPRNTYCYNITQWTSATDTQINVPREGTYC